MDPLRIQALLSSIPAACVAHRGSAARAVQLRSLGGSPDLVLIGFNKHRESRGVSHAQLHPFQRRDEQASLYRLANVFAATHRSVCSGHRLADGERSGDCPLSPPQYRRSEFSPKGALGSHPLP